MLFPVYNPIEDKFDYNMWIPKCVTVPAGQTLNLDSVPLASIRSAMYIITMFNPSGVAETLTLNVLNSSSTVTDSVSNKLGTGLSIRVNAVKNVSNMDVEIVNNEATAVDIKSARLLIC